jgi:hypothetical protein
MMMEFPRDRAKLGDLDPVLRTLVGLIFEHTGADAGWRLRVQQQDAISGAAYIDIFRPNGRQIHGLTLHGEQLGIHRVTAKYKRIHSNMHLSDLDGQWVTDYRWELANPQSLNKFEEWLRTRAHTDDGE